MSELSNKIDQVRDRTDDGISGAMDYTSNMLGIVFKILERL